MSFIQIVSVSMMEGRHRVLAQRAHLHPRVGEPEGLRVRPEDVRRGQHRPAEEPHDALRLHLADDRPEESREGHIIV